MPDHRKATMLDSMPIEEIVLEAFRYKARQHLPAAVFESMELTSYPDQILDGLIFEMKAAVYGKRGRECRRRITHEFPATWWDCLKRDVNRWATNPRWIWRSGDESRVHRLRRWFMRPVEHRAARLVVWWIGRHPIRISAKCTTVDFSERMLFPDSTLRLPDTLGEPHYIQRITAVSE